MIKDAANFQHSNVINLLLSRPKEISFPSEMGMDLAFIHARYIGGYGKNMDTVRSLLTQREGMSLPSKDVMLAAYQNKDNCLCGFETHDEKEELFALLRPHLPISTT